jgi:hypothetical protein
MYKQTQKHHYQKRIGNTIYNVEIHFDETSKETFEEKVLRLIKNDLTLLSKGGILKMPQTGGVAMPIRMGERSSLW